MNIKDHVYLLLSPHSPAPPKASLLPAPTNLRSSFHEPLSAGIAVHMCMEEGPSTGAWTFYQGPLSRQKLAVSTPVIFNSISSPARGGALRLCWSCNCYNWFDLVQVLCRQPLLLISICKCTHVCMDTHIHTRAMLLIQLFKLFL